MIDEPAVEPAVEVEVGGYYVAHAPGTPFGLDGRTVRVRGVFPDGSVEVLPPERWPEGDACPVGVSWDIPADRVADVLERIDTEVDREEEP